jgi:hypothetical protein
MGFYLHLEVDSSLSPEQFRARVIAPIAQALERERLGRIPDTVAEDEPNRDGGYDLALEVFDERRFRVIVEEVLTSVDS